MLNSYRVAILLMIVFGVVGIQAARYQGEEAPTACKRNLPEDTDITASESIASDQATLKSNIAHAADADIPGINKIAIKTPPR